MGNIPLVTRQRSALSNLPETQATGEAFGAQIGRAIAGVGDTISQVGGAVGQLQNEERTRQRNEQLASAVAQSDFTPQELTIQRDAPPDGSGVADATNKAYREFVETEANKITDPIVRSQYRVTMLQRAPTVSANATKFEFGTGAQYAEDQANLSLQALENKARSDPMSWDTVVQDGAKVIQARPGLPQAAKDGMIVSWQQRAAYARFQGMLSSAKSTLEFDNIEKELTKPDSPWQARMDPKQFDQTLDQITQARNAFATKADADARATLDSLEKRTNDLVPIDPQELSAAQKLVQQSPNPVTQDRMARVARDQGIISQERALPPDVVRSKIQDTNAGASASFPGVPPSISVVINNASSKFNVPASYLGGTVTREYGGQFTTPKPVTDFLSERAPDQDVAGLDANFASRLAAGIDAAEKATGSKAKLNDAYRPPERQAQYYADYTQQDVTYGGVTYHPQRKGGLAAKPGNSFHQLGQAADIAPGPVLDYLHAHAKEYGLTFLEGNAFNEDPVHIQLAQNVGGGYGARADATGSAVGVFQFQPQTWLDIMHDGVTPQRFGLDVTGKSDDELLALRKDDQVSAYMAAAYGEKNAKALTAVLGRAPTDTELYMAHFLGTAGATKFLTTYRDNPNAIAASLVPDAAEANKSVFYKNGTALTVQQVFNNIATSFATSPSRVAYGDNQVRQKIVTANDQGVKNDPISLAQNTGKFNVGGLDNPADFAARGTTARSVANYYSIPVDDMKPFTVDEAAKINAQYKGADADTQLQILASIQGMGSDMARAAYKQLGETNPTMAFAADLKYNRGGDLAASDVVRGQKRIDSGDKVVDAAISGANANNITNALSATIGAALYGADPRFTAALQKAAIAHYVETSVTQGNTGWNADAFNKSVNAVLGGTPGAPALGTVNGQVTMLPRGTDEQTFNKAVDQLTPDDLVRMSLDKLPPRYSDGSGVPASDIQDEGMFRAVGNDTYRIQFSDGGFAITGEIGPNGRPVAYLFVAKADDLKAIAGRSATAAAAKAAAQEQAMPTFNIPPSSGAFSIPEGGVLGTPLPAQPAPAPAPSVVVPPLPPAVQPSAVVPSNGPLVLPRIVTPSGDSIGGPRPPGVVKLK